MNPFIQIKGGTPLQGEIVASGAKNAMTKLLVASLISNKKCIFTNVPNIGDVDITAELCQELGAEISWDKEKKTIEIITKEISTSSISQKFSGANRIPILLIGSLLGRTTTEISVPAVGGDKLGTRPVNFHIKALEQLGAQINYHFVNDSIIYTAKAPNGLKGNVIILPFPSVGATENTILAAVRAKGTTIIKNAATEPEIIDLILFLQKLGVHITLDVDRTIRIKETNIFYEVEHNVLPDRNEVISYALAAISTKGKVFIKKAEHLHMITFLNYLRKVNGGFNVKKDGIEFFYKGPLNGGILIETDVHPGFMTDWQQPFAVLLTQSNGCSVIHETVYENRFGYTKTLNEMGADMELFTSCLGGKTCRFSSLNHFHSLIIKGPSKLKGKDISIPDLRAGFAYIMAALLAKDISNIYNIHFLDRGYENIIDKLLILGANIKKVDTKKDLLKKLIPLPVK